MNVRLTLLVTLAALTAATQGCSSSDNSPPKPQTEDDLDWNTPHPITLRQDAVLAPHGVSDTAVVQDGALVIPTTGANLTTINGWLGKLDVGKVIAGDRDQRGVDGSGNATGFLRRIVAIDKQADKIVITTSPAALEDLIEDGDLIFDSSNPTGSIFAQVDGVSLKPQTLHPLNETGQSSTGSATGSPGHAAAEWENEKGTNVNAGPTASFDMEKFAMNAKVDGAIKFRKWWKIPTGVERAELKLELDPEIEGSFDVGVTAGRTWSSTSSKATMHFASIMIPMGGPLPVTLRVEPGATISLTASGSVTAHGKGTGKGHAAAGFRYENGSLTNTSEAPTFDTKFEVTQITGKASFTIDAGPFLGLKLLAFDSVGLEGKVGIYDNITGEFCSIYNVKTGETKEGLDVKMHWGPKLEINGLVKIPLVDKELINVPLLTFETHSEDVYLIGNKTSCEFPEEKSDAGDVIPTDTKTVIDQAKTEFVGIDSCKGRADGVWCSQVFEGGAIVCKDQQIAYGLQCPTPGKCTIANPPETQLFCDGKPMGGSGGGGDAGTQVDSCNGKADGLYCSVLSPSAAYECKGGSTAGGQQCPSGKTCTGPNGGGATIVCN